jgi:hypothetical protein
MLFPLYLFITSPLTDSAMLNVVKAANWEFDALQNRVSNEKLHASSLAAKGHVILLRVCPMKELLSHGNLETRTQQ